MSVSHSRTWNPEPGADSRTWNREPTAGSRTWNPEPTAGSRTWEPGTRYAFPYLGTQNPELVPVPGNPDLGEGFGVSAFPFPTVPFYRNGNVSYIMFSTTFSIYWDLAMPVLTILSESIMGSGFPGTGPRSGFGVPGHGNPVWVPRYENPLWVPRYRNLLQVPRYRNLPRFPGMRTRPGPQVRRNWNPRRIPDSRLRQPVKHFKIQCSPYAASWVGMHQSH